MELTKNKYTKIEVNAMIQAYKAEYENLIIEQRATIKELTRQNADLLAENNYIKSRENLIATTLERAENNANKLEEKCKLQYSYEMQKLKEFIEKWNNYFNDLQEKYPLYSSIKQALDIKKKIEKSKEQEARETLLEIDEILSKQAERFNPKKKIDEYIATTTASTNGFNLDDVLNPGELKLEDICKELGLIEE